MKKNLRYAGACVCVRDRGTEESKETNGAAEKLEVSYTFLVRVKNTGKMSVLHLG